jgi:hypothetical protein
MRNYYFQRSMGSIYRGFRSFNEFFLGLIKVAMGIFGERSMKLQMLKLQKDAGFQTSRYKVMKVEELPLFL